MSRTCKKIYVPVDNSGHSFAAIDLAVDLATHLGAEIVGSHVSVPGTPDSYLDVLEECCRTASVTFERRTLDGRHHKTLLEDIERTSCDLVIMGALGEGAVDESQLGSVSERVVRGATRNILIVKDLIPDPRGLILVAVDGSPASLEALSAGLSLAHLTGRTVEGIVVGEKSVAGQATSAIEAARAVATAEGYELRITISEGKAFDRILKQCREKRPWLLVVGKTGSDADDDEGSASLGSTTGNLLRLSPSNVLVVPGVGVAAGARPKASRSRKAQPVRRLQWSEDAQRLLMDLPEEQRGDLIRTVEEGALRLGVSLVTADIIDQVMMGYIDS